MNRRKLLTLLAALPFAPKVLTEAAKAVETPAWAAGCYTGTYRPLIKFRPGHYSFTMNPVVLAAAYLRDVAGAEAEIDWGAVDVAAKRCNERIDTQQQTRSRHD